MIQSKEDLNNMSKAFIFNEEVNGRRNETGKTENKKRCSNSR